MFKASINDLIKDSANLEIKSNIFVIAEKYNPDKKSKLLPRLDYCAFGTNVHLPSALTTQKTFMDLSVVELGSRDTILKLSKRNFVRQDLISSNPNRSLLLDSKSSLEKKRSYSASSKRRKSAGYGKQRFQIEMLDSNHHIKPTKKIYRQLRVEGFHYIATFDLSNTWIATSNFRPNKAISTSGFDSRRVPIPIS